MMLDTVQLKLTEVKKRLEKIERKVEQQEAVQRVSQHLQRTNVTSAALKVAPADYYSWSLKKRGTFLQCCVPHLCKSIIIENTAYKNEGIEDKCNSRYYCIIVQYKSKLNTEQVMRFVRNLIPEDKRPGRKNFNFQHAPGKVSEELTGFLHNGVSPFGMKNLIPVIVSQAIVDLKPSFIWLGGGAENLKLRISVPQLVKSLDAFVADVTVPRTDLGQYENVEE